MNQFINSKALLWAEAKTKTKELFKEFYAQSDSERQMGWEPMPLMDRLKADEQPKTQMDFLTNITIPCLKLVSGFLPDATKYLNNCYENLENWRVLAKQMSAKRERLSISSEHMVSPIAMPKIGGNWSHIPLLLFYNYF